MAFINLKMELHWRNFPIGKRTSNLPVLQNLGQTNFTKSPVLTAPKSFSILLDGKIDDDNSLGKFKSGPEKNERKGNRKWG